MNHSPAGEHASANFRTIARLWWRVLRIAWLRFGFTGSALMAAAIAFFSLMCLAPLGILLAAGLQSLLGPGTDVYIRIQQTVAALGPDTAARIMPHVDDLLREPHAHIASVISVFTLAWAGVRLFETVERSLTAIWPGAQLRGYFLRKLVGAAMMLVAGLLLGGFVLFSAALAAAGAWLQGFGAPAAQFLDQMQPRFIVAYQIAASYVAFVLMYKFVPLQNVPTRAAMIGAAAATLMWHIASRGFSTIIAKSHHYGTVYGGLTGVVIFSFWALLGAHILVFAGHFAVAYEHVLVKQSSPDQDADLIGKPGRTG